MYQDIVQSLLRSCLEYIHQDGENTDSQNVYAVAIEASEIITNEGCNLSPIIKKSLIL